MLTRQFFIFLAVGLASAGLDLTVTGGLLRLGTHYTVAATLGFAMGLALNFLGHSRLSFPSVRSTQMAIRFSLVTAMNYLATLAMVAAAAHWLQEPLIGKVVSIPLVAIHGFLWGKYWVFK